MTVFQRYAGLTMPGKFMAGAFAAILFSALAFTLGLYAFTWAFGIIAVICAIVSATNW